MNTETEFSAIFGHIEPRPAYTHRVTTDGGETHDRPYLVTGWAVTDRRNPSVDIVDGLTQEQARKIADYLNAVTGAMEN